MSANIILEQSPICPPRRSLKGAQHYAFFQERCVHLHLDSASERMGMKLGFGSMGLSCMKPFEITRNGFPYHGYYHYILWINPIYEKFYSIDRIAAILERSILPTLTPWRIFKNLVTNQTIPGIAHYHLLHPKCSKDFRPPLLYPGDVCW